MMSRKATVKKLCSHSHHSLQWSRDDDVAESDRLPAAWPTLPALQWSRDDDVAEREVHRYQKRDDYLRFNGAATMMSRKGKP